MKLKVFLLVMSVLVLAGCKKDSVPKKKKVYEFTYKIRMPKKITEPTIISGFYGKVMKYEGNFMPSVNNETDEAIVKKPVPAQNEILVYPAEFKDKIVSVAYEEEGITFYDLKKLKKLKVNPKYVIKPSKEGFYQLDLATGDYCVLLKIKKKKAYYNGGVATLSATTSDLKELEMRIDYNASF